MHDDIFDELLVDYLAEASERIDQLEEVLLRLGERRGADERAELVAKAKLELHTLKGNSGMMGFGELQELAHDLEELLAGAVGEREARAVLAGLDRFRAGISGLRPAAEPTEPNRMGVADPGRTDEATIRVPAATIDQLVEEMSELVMLRNRLMIVIGGGKSLAAAGLTGDGASGHAAWVEAEVCAEALESALHRLREDLIRLRLVPLKPVLRSLKRLVRDETERTVKTIELSVRGEETPLDRSLSELASETLGHLVRNAIVHGIEDPAERRDAGKPPTGTVLVEASLIGSRVAIDVVDDGRGVDVGALRRAAHSAGIEEADEIDLHALVFHPGLSSRSEVSLGAGRGVGMSAVLEAVHRAGGSIELKTLAGAGTHFRLQFPLRVAISPVLLATVDGETFALPASSILETISFDDNSVDDRGVIDWRGRDASVIDLGRALNMTPEARPRAFAVIVEIEGRLRAVAVDRLGELEEVVVRPLDPILGAPPGIGGSSILSDGRVVLILDPTTLSSPQSFLERSA